MGRFRRFDGKRLYLGLMPQSSKGLLALLPVEAVRSVRPADGHQKKDRPQDDPLTRQQIAHRFNLCDIVQCESGVDLHRDFLFTSGSHDRQGAIKTSRHAANRVMRSRINAVEADGQPSHSRVAHAGDGLVGDEGSCRRRDCHLQPRIKGVFDDLTQIRPFERIAAGQNKHRRLGKLDQLVDELLRLCD